MNKIGGPASLPPLNIDLPSKPELESVEEERASGELGLCAGLGEMEGERRKMSQKYARAAKLGV